MSHWNHLEIVAACGCLLGTAWLIDHFKQAASRPVTSVTPTAPAVADLVPQHSRPSPTTPVVAASETPPPLKLGRTTYDPELSRMELPLDEATATALIRGIREPIPGAVIESDDLLANDDVVLAKSRGHWKLAVVEERIDAEQVRVRWPGSTQPPRSFSRRELRQVAEPIQAHINRAGQAVTSGDTLQPGTLLEALRPGLRWRSVLVLKTYESGNVGVHYIGWARSWDEVVPRQNLRFPTGATVD